MADEQEDANKRAVEAFLRVMDKSRPEAKRETVPMGFDDDGKPLFIVRWRK
jgi:hypothetical protein